MKIVSYIKKHGILHIFSVIYQYKLDLVIQKVFLLFLKGKELKNTIIIESHNDFDCNGGPIYDYLLENGYNKKYKIVWLLKNAIPKKMPENVCAYSLHKPGIMKNYHICTAKFFTADNDVIKTVREGQVSFYCTHGGIAIKNVVGLNNIPDTVDYILTSSDYYAPVESKLLGVEYPNNKMLDFGFPSNDALFAETESDIPKITDLKPNKVFLWMPTFRKGGGHNRNDSVADLPYGIPLFLEEEMFIRINESLKKDNNLLVIKLHPMQDIKSHKQINKYSNIVVLTGDDVKRLGVDNYRLLKDADALISDYSSIVYSYILLDRPIGFLLSDHKDYKLGFAMDNYEEYLVGDKLYTYEDFEKFLKGVAEGQDEYKDKRAMLTDKLYRYKDGNSCKRLVDFMENLC